MKLKSTHIIEKPEKAPYEKEPEYQTEMNYGINQENTNTEKRIYCFGVLIKKKSKGD